MTTTATATDPLARLRDLLAVRDETAAALADCEHETAEVQADLDRLYREKERLSYNLARHDEALRPAAAALGDGVPLTAADPVPEFGRLDAYVCRFCSTPRLRQTEPCPTCAAGAPAPPPPPPPKKPRKPKQPKPPPPAPPPPPPAAADGTLFADHPTAQTEGA